MISAKSYKEAKAILFSTTDHCDLAHPNNDIKTMTHYRRAGFVLPHVFIIRICNP
jgi:hypothetical protein